jgi:sugar lactone lactonase YvrE
MRSPLISTIALVLALAALATATSFTSAPAAAWNGREEARDGVTHILNPALPVAQPETITPAEAWRVGGDDEEDIIFGVLSSIAADSEGNIYLLDTQLSEVMVFSPDGEYIRSIGREGEGPGEFRRAGSLFFTPEGNVAVMQFMPGKIVTLTSDGLPAGLLKMPAEFDESPVFFGGGMLAGTDVVLATRTFGRSHDGIINVTNSLIRVNSEGTKKATYFEQDLTHNMANFTYDEKKEAQVLWTTDAAGNVYTQDNFDAYAINVFGTDGKLSRVIEREYEHRKRSDEEKEENSPKLILQSDDRRVESKTIISDTDRDVMDFYTRDDGSLWVLSSRGAQDQPEGTIATFDVFDRDGRFQQQVTIEGDGSFNDDGLHFVGDRLFVVISYRSARAAMWDASDEEDANEEEPEPMAVICYELGGIVKAAR